MSEHKRPLALATAAMMDIISRAQAMQAAVMRGAPQAELETMRREAHDVLDAYLDHSSEAAQAARALLES